MCPHVFQYAFVYIGINVDVYVYIKLIYFLLCPLKGPKSQDPVAINTLVPRSCSLILFPTKNNQSFSEKWLLPKLGENI